MTWEPEGIVVGDAFVDYVEDLRKTWPASAEHGVPAVKRDSNTETMKTDSNSSAQHYETTGPNADATMNRRRFMALTAATATV